MSMPYPDHDRYRRLYARYFQGNRTEQLLDLAGDLKGKRVVDLCGGGGRLTRAATERGAKVTLVDESLAMITPVTEAAESCIRGVVTWLQSFSAGGYQAMFCQQAVNYWLIPEIVDNLADSLEPGGLFIFNTFNRKPSPIPTLKQYELEGARFAEASWLSGGDMVEHVQMREGEPPHTTRFQWISPEDFSQWLGPRFDAVETQEGAASVWRCVRRP
jgi:SAM-dependent methyltransferase